MIESRIFWIDKNCSVRNSFIYSYIWRNLFPCVIFYQEAYSTVSWAKDASSINSNLSLGSEASKLAFTFTSYSDLPNNVPCGPFSTKLHTSDTSGALSYIQTICTIRDWRSARMGVRIVALCWWMCSSWEITNSRPIM